MNFPFFVARRYLFSKKSHNAVNIVTAISIVCVAIVTAALIIILSAMNGLSDLVESLYNSFHSDIRITAEKGKVFHADSLKAIRIKNIAGVNWYTEIVDENGLVENNEMQLIVTLRGVADDYASYTRFDTVVRQGKYNLHPNGQTGAIAGQEIGSRLQLSDMSAMRIYVPRRDKNLTVDLNNLDEEPFNKDLVFVSGLYSVSSDFDGKFVLMPIDAVRKLLDYTDECTSAEIGIAPEANSEEIIASIKSILGPGFKVENRYQQNEILFKTLKSEKVWTFLILIFVLVIATFNTIGSLTLLIIEKKKDIGVLWSMGTDRNVIRNIFFTEGLLISITGTLAGMVLGIGLCVAQQHFGFLRFSEGFVVDYYPVTIVFSDLLYILLAVTTIGLAAAWYPVNVYTKKYQHIRFNG